MTAHSIAADFDVNLENNYSNPKEYGRFSPVALNYRSLHTIRAGHGSGVYTSHDMGLPLLLSPFLKFGGRYTVQFFMNFTAALLCLVLYMLLVRLDISGKISAVSAMTASICMPLMAAGSLVLTKVPAALIVAYSLYILSGTIKSGPNPLFFALIAFLPWLQFLKPHLQPVYATLMILLPAFLRQLPCLKLHP